MSAVPLRDAHDSILDALVVNEHQAFRLANNRPGRDSLFEHLQHIRHAYSIRDEDMLPVFQALREVIELNQKERAGERVVARVTDDLLRAGHAAERPQQAPDAPPSIKRLADILRPHLAVLVDAARRDEADVDDARQAVRDVARRTPSSRLSSSTLRHELRGRRHDALLAELEVVA